MHTYSSHGLVSQLHCYLSRHDELNKAIEAVKIYEVRLKVFFFSNIKVDKSITKQHGQKGTN